MATRDNPYGLDPRALAASRRELERNKKKTPVRTKKPAGTSANKAGQTQSGAFKRLAAEQDGGTALSRIKDQTQARAKNKIGGFDELAKGASTTKPKTGGTISLGRSPQSGSFARLAKKQDGGDAWSRIQENNGPKRTSGAFARTAAGQEGGAALERMGNLAPRTTKAARDAVSARIGFGESQRAIRGSFAAADQQQTDNFNRRQQLFGDRQGVYNEQTGETRFVNGGQPMTQENQAIVNNLMARQNARDPQLATLDRAIRQGGDTGNARTRFNDQGVEYAKGSQMDRDLQFKSLMDRISSRNPGMDQQDVYDMARAENLGPGDESKQVTEQLNERRSNRVAQTEAQAKQQSADGYPDDVNQYFMKSGINEQTGEYEEGIDLERQNSFDSLRNTLGIGINESRNLAPTWYEGYQRGVNMSHLAALMKDPTNKELVNAFMQEYNYMPNFLKN